ncbi:hypothetical protein SHELI_v1c08830 [Spiroplasma helicoides]|uniref:Lipoprotein n=1 Tax=Spiroplasma helicoides TaxID=216938 RepID=A0A1B3SLM4_9MOLU|nr:lipoprotein [Spiroplasma helicoides]AOG60832.1 hypothetical protein SHELI_v1c08830 [Spiroplasma helicoides]
MKKLLSLLAATGLVASSSSFAVACKKDNLNESNNDVEKKDLETITNKDLGEITGVGDAPNLSDILYMLNSKNSDLKATDADVELDGTPTTTAAKIKAKSDSKKFSGSVDVKYTYKKVANTIKDLGTITNKDLGEITGVGDAPNLEDILSVLNSKNSDLKATNADVELDGTPTTAAAKIKAKSDSKKFSGSVDVKYTYKKVAQQSLNNIKVKELGDIIGTKDLDTFVTLAEIVTAINSKNSGYGLIDDDIEFVGIPTKKEANIKASHTSTKFTGTAKVTFNFRVSFNVSTLEDVINDKGLGSAARPNKLNVGFLMVPGYDQQSIMTGFQSFVVPLLEKAAMLGISITFDQIQTVSNIEFLDADGNKVSDTSGNTVINSIKLSAKAGKENSLDGVHIRGEGNIKLKKQKSASDLIKETNLGEIAPVDNSAYMIGKAILEAFLSKNNINDKNLKNQFGVTNVQKTSAVIKTVFNSDYSAGKNGVNVSFTIQEKESSDRVDWDLSKMSSKIEPSVTITSTNKGATLYKELFDSLTDTKNQFSEYWVGPYLDGFEDPMGDMYFIFDSQPEDEDNYIGAGTVSSSDFLRKFDTIFDINIDSASTKITLTVKSGKENFADGFLVKGTLTFKYTTK